MHPRSALTLGLVLLAFLLLPAAGLASVPQQDAVPGSAAPTPAPPETPSGPLIVRVYYEQMEDFGRLADFDVLEYNNTQEKYWLVLVDAAGYKRLQGTGLRVEVDEARTANLNAPRVIEPDRTDTIPGFTCYRTVEETYASAQALADAHPTLASWLDVGDSWQKSTGSGGYDMKVLKLTNSAIAGPKPKLFVTASIHAREYAPAELVTRFGEELVNGYGTDPDVTWLLDWHEVHLMLQTNPDGRKKAEAGQSWRKNIDNDDGCTASYPQYNYTYGTDLNRNFQFYWRGCADGDGCSSSTTCNETYRGPTAGAEPETQTVMNYLRSLFPDQRDPQLTSPAPADATGVYIDIHSNAALVLWPWGFPATPSTAPNSTGLQTLGRKLAYFNGYTPEQSTGLYGTDGTTIDFAYGDMGLAAYTIETSGDFFQPCTAFTNDLNGNLPALRYAAKVVRTPYQTPAGPDALSLAVTPAAVVAGNTVALTASINDTRYNNSNGTEGTQAIAAAQYYVDTPPWAGGTAIAMAASDGTFNSTTEGVTATVNTGCLAAGRHMLFVRGQDAGGNWGAFSAVFLNVTAPTANDFTLCVAPAAQPVCAPASSAYAVSLAGWGGFAGSVTLSTSGLPGGATASFSANPLAAPGSSTLTLGNTADVTPGAYTFTVTGTGPGGGHSSTAQLTVYAASLAAPVLSGPANGNTGIALNTALTWGAVTGAAAYEVQVATDSAFSNLVASSATLTTTSFTPKSGSLAPDTVYYWRVRAVRSTNACNSGWSAVAAFRTAETTGTAACYTVTSNDVPKAIPYNAYVDSAINFPFAFTLSDVNVKVDRLLHPNDGDVDMFLRHPDGTLVELSTDNGSTGDHYTNTVFDDAAATAITAGSVPFSGTYRPEGSLAGLNGKTSYGAWALHVLDDNNNASTAGTIQAWSLTLCGSVTATSPDYSDLPSAYGVAWHTGTGAWRLGAAWDLDSFFYDGYDNTRSDGGVTRDTGDSWNDGRGEVSVTVSGTAGQYACLNAWLDYSDGAVTPGQPDAPNGLFDANEHVVTNRALAPGASLVTWPVEVGVINVSATYNMRFRLLPAPNPAVADCSGVTLTAEGGAAGGEVEDYAFSPGPLAVELANFRGEVLGGRAVLTWETVSEQDNAGFNVYRGESEQGPWVKANGALIPSAAPGSSEGHGYTWTDAAPLSPGAPNGAYWYLLEDVDVHGATARHGPVQVGLDAPNAVTICGFNAAPDWGALLRQLFGK